jgi:hypothetical protein
MAELEHNLKMVDSSHSTPKDNILSYSYPPADQPLTGLDRSHFPQFSGRGANERLLDSDLLGFSHQVSRGFSLIGVYY